MCRLAKCCDASIFALAAKYHIKPHDIVRSSVAHIKDSFWFYFSQLSKYVLSVFLYLCVLLCVFCHVFYCSCCILIHNSACCCVRESLEWCQCGSWKTGQHGIVIVQTQQDKCCN